MNDFKILLQAVLDANSINQSDINKIQKVIEKYHLNLTADLDKASIIAEIKKIVPQLEAELQKVTGVDIKINDDALLKAFNQIEKQADKLAQSVNKIQLSLSVGDYDVQVASLTSKFQKWGLSVDEVNSKMSALNVAYTNLQNADTNDKRLQAEKEYQLALEKTNNELKLMSLNSASRTDRTNLSNKIQVWLDKNTKASNKARKELQDYIITLNSADEMGVPALQKIKNEFAQIEIAERGAGRLGKSFVDTLKAGAQKFIEWGLASNAVMAVWTKSKEMVDAVYEIDTAMTDLYKVTDETAERYDRFLDSASKKAKELGATVTDIINSTADFSKLGYSLDEASVLAEIATIYKNVGDIDIESATESIVSTMAAYGYTAEEAMQIIDKFNQVGNNFSISSADIGEALQRSASSLASSGNTLDESIALITAGNTIVQDADTVGTALKTVSLRLNSTTAELQAMGEETEYACETLSDYRNLVLGLTDNKVDIVDDNGEYKSTYQMLKEISEVWDELNSMEQSSLLKSLFGARQANIGASIITQFATAEAVLESSMNSSGSAIQENEKYLESLEGKITQFEASVQSLSNTLIDSDLLKFFVDFGTGAVTALDWVIDKIGTLGTIGLVGGGILGGKNIGRPKMFGLVLKYADNHKCSLGYQSFLMVSSEIHYGKRSITSE